MINPSNNKLVVQLNMGEGKSCVIVPMIIANLTKNSNHLIRVFVLNSLFNSNYIYLKHSLGCLLNKRIYSVPFNRDIDPNHIETYSMIMKECFDLGGFILTLPEHCLSMNLKMIDLCNSNENIANKFINLSKFLKSNCKDILDESDELLSVKYQLVYSIGKQSNLDGNKLRWEIMQDVLYLARKNLKKMKFIYDEEFSNLVEFKKVIQHKQAFPIIRLLNQKIYSDLCKRICDDFFDKIGIKSKVVELQIEKKKLVKDFILNDKIEPKCKDFIKNVLKDKHLKDIIYILRGILNYDILYVILSKRWKVDYGVNKSNKKLLQAVPFRAKDVPAERAQFAHPDISIGLTHLSYYYSGLNDSQMDNVFKLLNKSAEGFHIYSNWIKELPKSIQNDEKYTTIKNYSNLNLSDSNHKYEIVYPLFKMHTPVINYWLSEFLFPKEAKEFESRLSMSAWDLCDLNQNLVAGFSGTNDSRFLLPESMNYYDIPHLVGTNGQVISNLIYRNNLNNENINVYQNLIDNQNEVEILRKLYDNSIKVLLDIGALIIKLDNKQVALEWINMWNNNMDIEAVVYFDNNNLVVLEKQSKNITSFEVSIYKHKLEKCLIYLDESHCRGVDLQ